MYLCTYTYKHFCICACPGDEWHTYICVYIYASIFICTHIYTVYICIYTCIYICIYIHICTLLNHKFMYVYEYIHICAQVINGTDINDCMWKVYTDEATGACVCVCVTGYACWGVGVGIEVWASVRV